MANETTLDLWRSASERLPYNKLKQPIIIDFGLHTKKHYKALSLLIIKRKISIKELDNAIGNGERLTKLVNGSLQFNTNWDKLGYG